MDSVELCGAGALRRAFELTKKKLEQEGLFDPSRKREIVRFPEKIGVIASRESAAYTDFLRIINQRWGGLGVNLIHVQVQGEKAVEDIVSAFQYFNENDLGLDAIVLTRGGGSLEDLQAFNSEGVARAVFGSKIPVICGVGHERDESLADYVADVRAATPTHAAMLLVPDKNDILNSVDYYQSQLNQFIDNSISWHQHEIEKIAITIQNIINVHKNNLEMLEGGILASMKNYLERIQMNKRDVLAVESRLNKGCEFVLGDYGKNIENYLKRLDNLNPKSVLSRGYSIVRKNKKVVSSVKDLRGGDEIDLTLSDGKVGARVAGEQGRML